jgi:ABC-type multidrug transport system fused ATPase/permease subunit
LGSFLARHGSRHGQPSVIADFSKKIMNPIVLLKVAFAAIFFLMAAFFIFIALKTLVGRRPLVFSSRWLFALVCLAFLPTFANSIIMGFSSAHGFNMIAWMKPLMFTVLLAFVWIQMKGYMAFAISDTYFREALLASASKLGFTIEETMSRLKIKETGQEMQVAIQGWIGTAQLKATGNESKETVKQIAKGMTTYFQRTPGKMNYMTSYFYLVIGAFMVAMSVWMFTLKIK